MFQAKSSVKSVTQQEEEHPIYPEEANSTDTALWPPRGYHRKSIQFRPDSMTAAPSPLSVKGGFGSAADRRSVLQRRSEGGSCAPAYLLETSILPSVHRKPLKHAPGRNDAGIISMVQCRIGTPAHSAACSARHDQEAFSRQALQASS